MESESQRHILALPFPAQGHMNPMFHLCNRLASHGFFITLLVALKKENFVEPKDTCTNLRFVYLPEEFVPQVFTLINDPLEFLKVFETNLNVALPPIVQSITTDGPVPELACILADELIIIDDEIITRFGLCRASLSTFSASHLCIRRSLPILEAKKLLPFKEGDDFMVDFLPGLPPLHTRDFPIVFKVLAPGSNIKDRILRNKLAAKHSWVLINTFHELEHSQLKHIADETPQFVAVGPLLPPSAVANDEGETASLTSLPGLWSEDTECLSWLDKQPVKSVIYISFGSLAVVSEKQIREIVNGLELAGAPFLWVMRSNMLENTKLEDVFKESKLGKVVSWAPQLKVLQHPSVTAFLTHCGWNSILEAITIGVPVLCWPSAFYEQPLNCALAVDYWKIGVRMAPSPGSYVTAEDVASSIQNMTGDWGSECRANVLQLSAAARQSLSAGGDSDKNFKVFVHNLANRKRKSVYKQ